MIKGLLRVVPISLFLAVHPHIHLGGIRTVLPIQGQWLVAGCGGGRKVAKASGSRQPIALAPPPTWVMTASLTAGAACCWLVECLKAGARVLLGPAGPVLSWPLPHPRGNSTRGSPRERSSHWMRDPGWVRTRPLIPVHGQPGSSSRPPTPPGQKDVWQQR